MRAFFLFLLVEFEWGCISYHEAACVLTVKNVGKAFTGAEMVLLPARARSSFLSEDSPHLARSGFCGSRSVMPRLGQAGELYSRPENRVGQPSFPNQ